MRSLLYLLLAGATGLLASSPPWSDCRGGSRLLENAAQVNFGLDLPAILTFEVAGAAAQHGLIGITYFIGKIRMRI